MLENDSVIPLYHQLKELFKEKIDNNYFKEGEKVPSENKIMKSYDISRATVRRALTDLTNEGLIYKKQGVGSFVAKKKVSQHLIREFSFNQQAKKHGFIPSSNVIYKGFEKNNTAPILETFNLKKFNNIIKIIRVRMIDKEPLILEYLYIPFKLAPNILNENLSELTIFDYLKNTCNLNYSSSTLDIEPIMTNEFEANYLNTKINTLGLSIKRIIYINDEIGIIQKRIMRSDTGKLSFIENQEKNNFINLNLLGNNNTSEI